MSADTTIIYYTDNSLCEDFATLIRSYLILAANGKTIISVSQKPIALGQNICVGDIGRSYISLFSQTLMGVERAKTRYIALAEHDCLYTPEHFDWVPPTDSLFYYNVNSWLLQWNGPAMGQYRYYRRKTMSMLICNRQLYVEAVTEKIKMLKLGYEMKMAEVAACEPGVCDGRQTFVELKRLLLDQTDKEFGRDVGKKRPNYGAVGFRTQLPNVDIRHRDNFAPVPTKGINPSYSLLYWGRLDQILKGAPSVTTEQILLTKNDGESPNIKGDQDMAKFGRGSWKRWQHSYIGSIIFGMDEIMGQLMDFADRRRPGRAERRQKTLPLFVEKIAEDVQWTDEQLEADPWYAYLCELYPTWRASKKKARVLQIMRETIKIYHDIKDNGLKSPLDMWREGKDRLVLHHGWRRLIIMNVLHKRGLRDFSRVPVRVFKSKLIFQKYAPSPAWASGPVDDNSIHGLAMKQFCEKGVYATDKYWVHGYTRQYDRHFAHLRDKPVKLLEIGVFRGASLLLWKEAFPKGQIFGVDKNTAIWQNMLKGQERIKVFVGKQEDEAFLKSQVVPTGPYDIIIDDGGHSPLEQLTSFNQLWPHLAPGGIYVLEDLHRNTLARQAKEGPLMIDKVKSMIGDTIETNECLELQSVHAYYNIVFLQKT